MKRFTGFSSARLILWIAASTFPLAAFGVGLQSKPAIAQTADKFEMPAKLPEAASVSIGSDASMAAVSESLRQQFVNQFSDAAVTVETEPSDAALNRLSSGQVDMAATGRPLSDAEQSEGLTPVVLEREKIAVFVAEENAFQGDVGYTQFAQIFRGELTDWSELGGEAGAIRFIDRPDSSDTRKSLSFYPVFEGAPFAAGATAQAVAEDNTALVIKNLGTDGISYAPYSQVKDASGIRILSMHQVLPNDAAYPYSQPRVLVYKGDPSPAVQAFLAVATDSAGQTAIAQAEAAEAAALSAGENPVGEQTLARLSAGVEGATDAVGDAAGGVADGAAAIANDAANVAGDAAGQAVDAASNAAGALEGAAGDVAGAAGDAVGAAGDAASGAATAAGDAASNVAGAAGDAVSNLPGADAIRSRGLSPLWGVLPLAAIAAGGGLLWWLAAGKDDEDKLAEPEQNRELVGAGVGLRGKAKGVQAGAAGLGAAGLGAAGAAFGKAKNGVNGAVDGTVNGVKGGVSSVGRGVKGGATNLGQGLKNGAGRVGEGIQAGTAGVGNGIKGGVDGLKNGASTLGQNVQNGATGAAKGTQNLGRNLAGGAAGLAGGVAAAGGAAAAAAGGAADGAAKTGGGFLSGLFGKAKDAAGTATDAAGAGIKGTGDMAAGAVGGVTGTVGGVANKLSDGANNVADGLKAQADRAVDGVRDSASNLNEAAKAEETQRQSDDWSSDV